MALIGAFLLFVIAFNFLIFWVNLLQKQSERLFTVNACMDPLEEFGVAAFITL